MKENLMDGVAIVANGSTPAWVPILTQVNVALTFTSLVFSLVFGAWRFYEFRKKNKHED